MLGINPLAAFYVPPGALVLSLIDGIPCAVRDQQVRAAQVTPPARKLKLLKSKIRRQRKINAHSEERPKKLRKFLLLGQTRLLLPSLKTRPPLSGRSPPSPAPSTSDSSHPPSEPASLRVLRNAELVSMVLEEMRISSSPSDACLHLAYTALVSPLFNRESERLLYRDIVVRGPAQNALHHRKLISTKTQSHIHTRRSLCIAYQGHTVERYDVLGGLEHTHRWRTLVLDLREILSYKPRIQKEMPSYILSSNPPPVLHAGGLAKKRFRHLRDLTILEGRGCKVTDLTPKGAVERPLRFRLERLSIGAPKLPWLDGCPVLLISIFVTSAHSLTTLVLDYPEDHPILPYFTKLIPLVKDTLRVLEFVGDFLPSVADCIVELDIKLRTFKSRQISNLELITLLHPTGGLPSTLKTLCVPPYLPDTHRFDWSGKEEESFRGALCEVVGVLHTALDGPRGHTLKTLELTFVPGAPKNHALLRSLKRKCKSLKIEVVQTLL